MNDIIEGLLVLAGARHKPVEFKPLEMGSIVAEQARLFTPFTRIHTSRAERHGLGLSIVQRIVERQGGQAGVESEPGQGSRFFFTLPAA